MARKVLKGIEEGGHSLSIGEDITAEYQQLIKTITDQGHTCWFWNGKVFIKRADGSSVSVHIQDDWESKVNDTSGRGRRPQGTQLVARVVFDN